MEFYIFWFQEPKLLKCDVETIKAEECGTQDDKEQGKYI